MLLTRRAGHSSAKDQQVYFSIWASSYELALGQFSRAAHLSQGRCQWPRIAARPVASGHLPFSIPFIRFSPPTINAGRN